MDLSNIILFACTAFAGGIWLAKLYSWSISVLIILSAALLIAALWRVVRNYQRSFWTIIALFFLAGMLCYTQTITLRADDISNYAGQTVTLEGTITEVPEIIDVDTQKRLVRYVIRVEKVKQEASKSTVPASGNIRINIQPKEAAFKPAGYGDKVSVTGKVLELRGYNNPGQIDTTASLRREGILARMSVPEEAVKVIVSNKGFSWQTALADWRKQTVAGLQKVMPANDAAILTALLFGGYQGIRKEVVHDFTATGLVHILSVSGAHIALVAGLVMWFGRRFRLNALATAVLAAGVVILYACISGLTPPVIRSALMGLISLLAVILGRDSYAPAALACTALAMLVYQPLLLFDISFQLSFGATAGLVFLYPPTLSFLSRWPAWLAGPVAVTLCAQLGVLPIIAWYFNNFSLISFAANIIVLPIVELVIILGLAGILIYTILPAVGSIIFVISSLFIGLVIQLTALLAAVPYSAVYIPSVGIAGCAAYYLLLAWVYGWCPFIPGCKELVTKWPKTCILAGIILIAGMLGWSGHSQILTVHFIDVGQGDATLIITPQGKAVVVDTGGTLGDSSFDIGERVVAPYLKHYGVTAIDYLILTHGHQDHAGGAAGVANAIKVDKLLLPREEPSPAVQALFHTKSEMTVIPTYTGQQFQLDLVVFTVEHAVGDQQASRNAASSNEVSSVVRVSYGRHSFLLTGDLEAKGEAAMLASGVAPCTVLKTGHHGARTSTSDSFLQAISPEYAVISVGNNNRFGHPHPETLKRLRENKVSVYRTDKHGAIVFTSNGNHMEVNTYVK